MHTLKNPSVSVAIAPDPPPQLRQGGDRILVILGLDPRIGPGSPSPVEVDTDSRVKPENDDGLRAAARIAAPKFPGPFNASTVSRTVLPGPVQPCATLLPSRRTEGS